MAFRRSKLKKYLINTATALYLLLVFYGFTNESSRCRTSMPDQDAIATFPGSQKPRGVPCRVDLDTLHVMNLDLSPPNLTQIELENSVVRPGGEWAPSECAAWQTIAIIVPYRNRWEHLQLMLRRLHPMLRRQKASYQIIVVEQAGTTKFNRGRLMNIGVVEAKKLRPFNCFIFHDADLLPENDKNLYYCDQHIRQLSSAIDEMRYHVMYYNYAGGVVALNYENAVRVNGYSNDYWGWGNEDDDFSARTMEAGLLLTRPPDHIGRFKMVRHTKEWRAENGYDLFLTWRNRWRKDGLNSLDSSKYKLVKTEKYPLFTKLVVDVGQAPKEPPDLTGVRRESFAWFLKFFFP